VVAVGDEAADEGLNVGDKVYFGTLAQDYKDEYLKYHDFKDGDRKFLVMSWKDVCFVEEV
jgi:co-chaperonin GroES (HSP10)